MNLLQLTSLGGVPEILTDVFAKNCTRIPTIGRSISRIAQWLTLSFVRTRLGKRISNATHDDFPLGYFLIAEKLR